MEDFAILPVSTNTNANSVNEPSAKDGKLVSFGFEDILNELKSNLLGVSIGARAEKLIADSEKQNVFDRVSAKRTFDRESAAGNPDAKENYEQALENLTPVLSRSEATEQASETVGANKANEFVNNDGGLSVQEASIIGRQFTTNEAFKDGFIDSAVESFAALGRDDIDADFVESNVLGLLEQAGK